MLLVLPTGWDRLGTSPSTQGNAGGCGEKIKLGLGLIYYLLKPKPTPKQSTDRSINPGQEALVPLPLFPGDVLQHKKQAVKRMDSPEGGKAASSSLGLNEAASLKHFCFPGEAPAQTTLLSLAWDIWEHCQVRSWRF